MASIFSLKNAFNRWEGVVSSSRLFAATCATGGGGGTDGLESLKIDLRAWRSLWQRLRGVRGGGGG
jgi:hypothetical protein